MVRKGKMFDVGSFVTTCISEAVKAGIIAVTTYFSLKVAKSAESKKNDKENKKEGDK